MTQTTAQAITDGRPPELLPLADGVSLRRRTLADASALNTAICSALDHLRPWMPWAAAAPALRQTEEMIRQGEAAWEAGADFWYLLGLDAEPGSVIGAFALHGRIGPGALEIGYWMHPAHTRRGLAGRAAGALTEAALALPGIERVEIQCDEANTASAAIPRRLGYRLDRIEPREIIAPGESGRTMVWITALSRDPG